MCFVYIYVFALIKCQYFVQDEMKGAQIKSFLVFAITDFIFLSTIPTTDPFDKSCSRDKTIQQQNG